APAGMRSSSSTLRLHLPVKRRPLRRARTVNGRGLAQLVRAQVGRSSGEAVVDVGQADAGIDGFASRFEREIQIDGFIGQSRLRRIRRRRWTQALEDVVVHFNSVGLLARRGGELRERLESLSL